MSISTTTHHPLQCQCGKLQGDIEYSTTARRAICYCKDCQAYAHFLGQPQRLLNAQGGTSVLGTVPSKVHFTQGLEYLACMCLSPQGTYRWYASCCNTPIGNTPRSIKIPYLALVENCLPRHLPLTQIFGEVKLTVKTASAQGHVPATPIKNIIHGIGLLVGIATARMTGNYRNNPFFADDNIPIRQPLILTPAQRQKFTPM